jgi:hypothetical protein
VGIEILEELIRAMLEEWNSGRFELRVLDHYSIIPLFPCSS